MLSGLETIQKLKSLSSHPALINEKYSDLSAMDIPKLTETLNIIEEVSAKGEKVFNFHGIYTALGICTQCNKCFSFTYWFKRPFLV
jgi:hypothetical protein